jgi:hypothetical protein
MPKKGGQVTLGILELIGRGGEVYRIQDTRLERVRCHQPHCAKPFDAKRPPRS